MTLAERIPDVTSGAVDLVADTMTINCQRRTQVDFSAEYYDAASACSRWPTRRRRPWTPWGARRCARRRRPRRSSTCRPYRPTRCPIRSPIRATVSSSSRRGKVDAISTDDTVLAGLAAQDPYTKIIGPAFTDEPYGMAISLSHPEFTAFVNGVLTGLRTSGELKTLYTTWLGKAFGQGLPPIPPFRYHS